LESQTIIGHAGEKSRGALALSPIVGPSRSIRNAHGQIRLHDPRIHFLFGDGITTDGEPIVLLQKQSFGFWGGDEMKFFENGPAGLAISRPMTVEDSNARMKTEVKRMGDCVGPRVPSSGESIPVLKPEPCAIWRGCVADQPQHSDLQTPCGIFMKRRISTRYGWSRRHSHQ